MTYLIDQYNQWLTDLERRKKDVLNELKQYEALKEMLSELDSDIVKVKAKINSVGGPDALSAMASREKPYAGMKITDAAKQYLSAEPSNRRMKGIVEALRIGGIDATYNTIQAVINKQKDPKGPFVKNDLEWSLKK